MPLLFPSAAALATAIGVPVSEIVERLEPRDPRRRMVRIIDVDRWVATIDSEAITLGQPVTALMGRVETPATLAPVLRDQPVLEPSCAVVRERRRESLRRADAEREALESERGATRTRRGGRPRTRVDVDAVRRMQAHGMTMVAIAESLGIGSSTLRRALERSP